MGSQTPLRHAANGIVFSTVLLLSLPGLASAQQVAAPQTFDRESYDLSRVIRAAESGRPVLLRFAGADHMLRLEESHLRSERFTMVAIDAFDLHERIPPRRRLYQGTVDGEPRSVVRLAIDEEGIRGVIKSSAGWAFIEPEPRAGGLEQSVTGNGVTHRVYSDEEIDPHFTGECVEVHSGADHVPRGASSAAGLSEEAVQGSHIGVLELAVVADFEFYQIHGADTLAEIETLLNAVDGIYETELGLSIEIVSFSVFEDASDSYEATDALDLLLELRADWNQNRNDVDRDAVHLFTGKDLDGSTVGIAYVGVVCSLSYAYSLSQELLSDPLETVLVAHELGHALGAVHDPHGSSPRYIMYPSLGSSNLDEFSEASAQAITDYVTGAQCLDSDSGGVSDSNPPSSGGGGGGGGPVDPLVALTALLVAAGEGLRRSRRREK
jgi:hypothetical protein